MSKLCGNVPRFLIDAPVGSGRYGEIRSSDKIWVGEEWRSLIETTGIVLEILSKKNQILFFRAKLAPIKQLWK